MNGEWRDATFAEYAKLPLENCHVLNEEVLLGRLGYRMVELQEMNKYVHLLFKRRQYVFLKRLQIIAN